MAAANAPDIGTGTTITWLTPNDTTVLGTILNFDWAGLERTFVPTSHLGTTGGATFIPARLYDPGRIDVTMLFAKNMDWINAIDNAASVITITFPLQAGEATASKVAGSAFLVSLGVAVPLEDKMQATVGIKFSGTLTFTAAT